MSDQAHRVMLVVKETLGLGTVPLPESSFVADLGCDSLDLVELVMEAESEFNIRVNDDDIGRLLTVRDLITYVTNATGEQK